MSQVWEILPKTLNGSWGSREKTFNGDTINFEFNILGFVQRDIESINALNFNYITSLDSVSFDNSNSKLIFSGYHAKIYDNEILGVNLNNYTLNSNALPLEIKPYQLSYSWDNTTTTYTGNQVFMSLIIKGFFNVDALSYSDANVTKLVSIQSNGMEVSTTNIDNDLLINFSAINANEYSVFIKYMVG